MLPKINLCFRMWRVFGHGRSQTVLVLLIIYWPKWLVGSSRTAMSGVKLTSTLRPAERKECVLSWKLLPCTSFEEIRSASVQTHSFPPDPGTCPTGTHPLHVRVADVGLVSAQALWFCFGDGQQEDGMAWNCRIQMIYKRRKDSTQRLNPKLKVLYRWWRSSLIHSVAPCRSPRAGPPPGAGRHPPQRPAMAWQTPHDSSATQPVFF